ncbi:hypothetical protein RB653_007950 [Dictyostelium firmibasis]|uniref:Transmembrane protein n=1 Tax=Dictyostelium firmibasis TaxID=79012 RepID=A0AAN7TVG4_9MYCE
MNGGAPTKIANLFHKSIVTVLAITTIGCGFFVFNATGDLLERRRKRKEEEDIIINQFIENDKKRIAEEENSRLQQQQK